MRFTKAIALLTAALLSFSLMAEEIDTEASSDDWGGDDWGDSAWGEETTSSPWSYAFHIDYGMGVFSSDREPIQESQSLNEARVFGELSRNFDTVTFKAKGYILEDRVLEKARWFTRELLVSFTPTASIDAKLGRQILTWGTGDLVFLNDLFPKDWQSFFSGRDLQYLKKPSDSIKVSYFNDLLNLDLVWTPVFTPDNYLTGERFAFYNPGAGMIISAPNVIVAETPEEDLSHGEWALRVFRRIGQVEFAFYGYSGYFKQPTGFDPVQGVAIFPELSSVGASARATLLGGIGHMEWATYESEEDKDGTNPMIANGQHRFLLGFEKEILPRFTVGLQYYLEMIRQHDELIANSFTPNVEPPEQRNTITTRLTYRAMQDKLTLSLFAFVSPNQDDSFLLPKVQYRVNDQWSWEVGANMFNGEKPYTFLGQFEPNSNVYGRVEMRF